MALSLITVLFFWSTSTTAAGPLNTTPQDQYCLERSQCENEPGSAMTIPESLFSVAQASCQVQNEAFRCEALAKEHKFLTPYLRSCDREKICDGFMTGVKKCTDQKLEEFSKQIESIWQLIKNGPRVIMQAPTKIADLYLAVADKIVNQIAHSRDCSEDKTSEKDAMIDLYNSQIYEPMKKRWSIEQSVRELYRERSCVSVANDLANRSRLMQQEFVAQIQSGKINLTRIQVQPQIEVLQKLYDLVAMIRRVGPCLSTKLAGELTCSGGIAILQTVFAGGSAKLAIQAITSLAEKGVISQALADALKWALGNSAQNGSTEIKPQLSLSGIELNVSTKLRQQMRLLPPNMRTKIEALVQEMTPAERELLSQKSDDYFLQLKRSCK